MSDPQTWRNDHRNGEPLDLPPEIDITVPSVARGYDYALGGKNNFEVDRIAGDALIAVFPGILDVARDNRAFLRRGVRHLVADAGIRQLIDVGSGLPSAGNVHEVAHQIDPTVRVVYVDIDPIVLAHGRALLADNETTTVIQGDAGDPKSILDDPATRELIDLDQPYGVIMCGILHHLPDERDPVHVTQVFKDAMPTGSYLLASNFLDDDDIRAREAEKAITSNFGTGRFRTWAEQQPFFDGLDLIEPGLVYANDWRPDRHTEINSEWHTFYCAGAGRKP
ncbi:SAM-dependent methyltransferase [Pseudonocardia sp. TRM90224]|uniref:SAM-dependent methyltransferase n=1 Tax=Pseudonocardia sp. TRM90224 TaxID=2812678 RepID=UPI001E451ADB|nr:SAM-dependent methyltransferase [Pseudonocardia sp. TRM90224]